MVMNADGIPNAVQVGCAKRDANEAPAIGLGGVVGRDARKSVK